MNIEVLQNLEPISSLTPDQLQDLAAQSSLEHLDTGSQVFREGDVDHQAIYLVSGTLELSLSGTGKKRLLNGGSHEARHPVANEEPRRISAITITPAQVLRIDKDVLDTMLTWGQISAPETEVVMSAEGIISVDKGSWLKKMIKSPAFRKLPPANIEGLLNRLEPVKVHAGEVIIRQGDAGDYFYMIDEGSALVTRNPDDDEDSIELAELNEGQSFGEAALISDRPRNATVLMMSDGVLLRLSKNDFRELLEQPTLRWIPFAEACARIDKGAKWVDVRLASEFECAHLPGAINIPMQMLHKKARELDRSRFYMCYCQTGRRSSAASFVLMQYGLKAAVLKNGLQDVPSDYPTDSDSGLAGLA